MSSSHDADKVVEGLRERTAANAGTRVEVQPTRSLPENKIPAKDRHTFGRTPDGTVFMVPVTHDMVSQLFDPRQPRNLSDYFVITVLALHVLLLYALPTKLRGPIFAMIFLFWRACYNGGIGYLLQIQSHHRRLVTWAKSYKVFEIPSTGKNPRPWLYNLIKREVEAKISDNYKFDEAPIEYNTWLVFRRFVDLILMCDFTSYCLLAIAYGKQPADESTLMLIARWVCGLILIVFNLWVKLDAHRVVKDYAWYWGDFFYLIDQDLTFDGVYDIAPHPMYSVGYAGYYGISMLAASYNLLFISILAHAAQFAFLVWIENPHIEKTYNPPAPRKRVSSHTPAENLHQRSILGDGLDDQLSTPLSSISNVSPSPSPYHKLLGWQNFDPFRNTDVCVILLLGYVAGFALFTPDTLAFRVLFVLHAVAWRLWYTVGLGIVLGNQSNKKSWTRHFLKHGESVEEAWRQWKGIYYMSMAMCWASFVAATWKMYSMPEDWGYGLVLLKHVLGVGLVVLQIWTAASIYDSLGEFGWFFGDFFFDHAPKLTYSGIYRYLNNPERILGLAGVWGAVFITRSQTIFFLALLSHTLTLASIQFVERPHMDKLYGQSLRKEAGLTKSIKRSLPPPFQQWQGNVDRVFQDTGNFFEEFIDAARPKLAAGVSTFVKDTSALFSQYPARLTITRLAPDLAGFKPKDYSLKIEGISSVNSATTRTSHGLDEAGEHTISRPLSPGMDFKPLNFEYGAPITVEWTAPVNHSKKDWIGLYMVVDNNSRSVSRVSSAGRWIPTTPNEYDSSTADSGILVADVPILEPVTENDESVQRVKGRMQFVGDKIWWTHGVYEFRYHHDGKHNVMAISSPFEIRIPRFDEESLDLRTVDLRTEVERALLPVVQNCFDRDPEIAPKDAEEVFGEQVQRDSKYAKRVVFAVSQMFGVEFASSVVLVDGCVKNLAWRICNAKEVLAPYSMDSSNGTTTPIGKD